MDFFVIISPCIAGKVTNIPGGMVTDQFGMVGLLTFIRAAETDHNLVSLALGSDLTTLGLNLNSPENLYPNFAGPWAETPCRPQDIDYHVPQEYLTNQQIRSVVVGVLINFVDDKLFFYAVSAPFPALSIVGFQIKKHLAKWVTFSFILTHKCFNPFP